MGSVVDLMDQSWCEDSPDRSVTVQADEGLGVVRLVTGDGDGRLFMSTPTPYPDSYSVTVFRLLGASCKVELLRNQRGLLHVSNMTDAEPAPPAREVVEVGQELDVKVVEVDR